MISFQLTDDQEAARSMFEAFANREIRPLAAATDLNGAAAPEARRAVAQIGILGNMLEAVDMPGSDVQQSRLLSCLLLEELGWADTSLAVETGGMLGFARAVLDQGSVRQVAWLRERFSKEHDVTSAVAFLEPGFGSKSSAISTSAIAVSDGYRLSGIKAFVPSDAKHLCVITRCEEGYAAFLIDRSQINLRFEPTPTMGLRGLTLGQIHLDDLVVPSEARLGENRTVDIQSLISASSLGSCAILTGLARAVFEYVTPYAKERVVHGSPLAQKQSVAFRLADMVIEIPAMRWSTWRGAVALEKGGDSSRQARLAQIYCRSRSFAIADEGVQLLGGHGYMKEHPVERWYRDARTLSLLDGIVGI